MPSGGLLIYLGPAGVALAIGAIAAGWRWQRNRRDAADAADRARARHDDPIPPP